MLSVSDSVLHLTIGLVMKPIIGLFIIRRKHVEVPEGRLVFVCEGWIE